MVKSPYSQKDAVMANKADYFLHNSCFSHTAKSTTISQRYYMLFLKDLRLASSPVERKFEGRIAVLRLALCNEPLSLSLLSSWQ